MAARLEDVLDLYAEPGLTRPSRWCASTSAPIAPGHQLVSERAAQPPRRARGARYDYEYKREGTANLFIAFEPKAGRRRVAVRPPGAPRPKKS